jgi:hypothetical protein
MRLIKYKYRDNYKQSKINYFSKIHKKMRVYLMVYYQ